MSSRNKYKDLLKKMYNFHFGIGEYVHNEFDQDSVITRYHDLQILKSEMSALLYPVKEPKSKQRRVRLFN